MKDVDDHLKDFTQKSQARHMPNEGSRNSNDRISYVKMQDLHYGSGNLQVLQYMKEALKKASFFTGLVYDQPV